MKLRIAQVGSLYENIPPPLYGGTERIISSLTEGLVKNGLSWFAVALYGGQFRPRYAFGLVSGDLLSGHVAHSPMTI